jgi:hypothetical protein
MDGNIDFFLLKKFVKTTDPSLKSITKVGAKVSQKIHQLDPSNSFKLEN